MQISARLSPTVATQSGPSCETTQHSPLWRSRSHPGAAVIVILITPQGAAQAPPLQSLWGGVRSLPGDPAYFLQTGPGSQP
ncbi:hypothetical protein CgunFtcFv8_004020 [Champsocephalus gunnari]|uniref:Uncharacterized protein n=1 Tax=Champsocephalus gunnari TaxID=52237 RepID=A0AAN8HYB8_CHAGU|nr:hypothetical protein CgunFtcFv8_004020 [Champsocephalus gunnari]